VRSRAQKRRQGPNLVAAEETVRIESPDDRFLPGPPLPVLPEDGYDVFG
jgi:hypothetical protein